MDLSKLTPEELIKINNVDNWKQSLFNCVGVISFVNESGISIPSGTGTILIKDYKENRCKIFLITNKHVLPTQLVSSTITFTLHAPWSTTKTFKITIPIYDVHGNASNIIKFNPQGEDVAVIDFTEAFVNNYGDIRNLEEHLPPIDILATTDNLKQRNLTIGDEVFFIGYPSFFYNEKNSTPLLRSGVIATDPTEVYYFNSFLKPVFNAERLNGFLIDANVFGGSSGSLVITKSNLIQMYDRQIMPSLQKATPCVVGILTHSYPSLNGGDNFQKLGLGGVIKSEYIIETINEFS
ncbi:hypothetical protein [Chryseobacterium oncorhynchi]|uniref:Serine protease n=1 Tax=Chryseobacterium oncorhynchi TaxID=741074 RepID=A0A316WP03_9FLAO|nr:hypothetical protein [Chryseobacterium oncorhynchi]PWN62226.1 hypothetical protein C1638_017180 [Chryseobacterium oncorhynchi]